MSGQTTRENVEQEVEFLFNNHLGTTWSSDDLLLFPAIVDLIVWYLR